MSTANYNSFPSIERLENIYCVISEKIDGTNGLIEVAKVGKTEVDIESSPLSSFTYNTETEVRFGSRNRYITFSNDNAGFANFFRHYEARFKDVAADIILKERELAGETLTECQEHYPLRIYGEWFGSGIQRGYSLKDKFFMPFSTFYAEKLIEYQVPNIITPNVMYTGKFSMEVVSACMQQLKLNGSGIVKDYKQPEGIVIFFPKYNFRLKETFDGAKWKNALPKSEHDKKPVVDNSFGQCSTCGKRLYPIKDGSGIPKCMNIHCKESPNYKE